MEGLNLDWLTEGPWPVLIPFFTVMILLGLAAFLMGRASTRAYQRLLAEGEPAEATVLAAKDTGWHTNKRPHISYELEVRREGRPPYTARVRLLLHRPWSPIPYPPGSRLRVRVDRDRPDRVAIEGGTPVLGGAMAGGGPGLSLSGQISAANVYIVNGQTYDSLAAMPPEVRAAFEQASAALADANQNGLPDLFEGMAGAADDPRARLRALKALLDEGLISQSEYEAKRAAILDQL